MLSTPYKQEIDPKCKEKSKYIFNLEPDMLIKHECGTWNGKGWEQLHNFLSCIIELQMAVTETTNLCKSITR